MMPLVQITLWEGYDENISRADSDSSSSEDASGPQEVEYWEESDNEIDNDTFPEHQPSVELETPVKHDQELNAFVWWTVAFTCVFQTFHGLSTRAVQWLLLFISVTLVFLGKFSVNIARIAKDFPATLHRRFQYLKNYTTVPSVEHYVACSRCHRLFKMDACSEQRGSVVSVKRCPSCLLSKKQIYLLKEVITSKGTKKLYPHRIFPYCSLVSALQIFVKRPGFLAVCDEWRRTRSSTDKLTDIYDGSVWKGLQSYGRRMFLGVPNTIAFMLNVDWFQPYKHRTFSVGVVYLAIANLPRNIRFKRENIIIIGILPGPTEPPLTMNSYLNPLVSELKLLWDGHIFKDENGQNQFVRCGLICIATDLPAGRKCCGFLSYTANLGCARCYCEFSTGRIGANNYGGFNRATWKSRSKEKHLADAKKIKECNLKTTREKMESKLGCRYTPLLELTYFDPVKMLSIDGMHNMYLGTAKHILHNVWIAQGHLNTPELAEIDRRMSVLIIPSNVHFSRIPVGIGQSKSFTAEQWMVWVNYYSIFCLYEILPVAHFECWRHFVLASRLLCSKVVSSNDATVADALLLNFCRRFELLYGSRCVTPNIHLHCHLVDCVRQFGPLASFWCFSFERMNGVLGNQPTNNRSIEVQFLRRFLNDNSHFQFLTTQPSVPESSDVNQVFSRVVAQHALSFYSAKHLSSEPRKIESISLASGLELHPPKKYTLSRFSEAEMVVVSRVLRHLYPESFSTGTQSLAITYKRMESVEVKEQELRSGQIVFTKSIFPLPGASSSHAVQGAFTQSDLHPAKIAYFALCSQTVTEPTPSCVTTCFAMVDWLEHHPLQSTAPIGKPFQMLWKDTFLSTPDNFLTIVENISCIALTANYTFHGHNVLAVTPLIL